MLFNSLAFAIFLPIVFIMYWAVPHKFRWVLILVTSYYYYISWNAKYIFLIFAMTVISYFAARFLEKEHESKKKKWILATAVVVCLGVLFFFKYFNFISESVTGFLNMFALKLNPVTMSILLPVGISFYTFQTLGYVIDVYRGEVSAERHFGEYAAFVCFFPQLLAGPIGRTGNLLPQIKAEHKFDYNKASYGLKLMAWGYFKKIIIADTLSIYVNKVYDAPQQFEGFSLVLTAVLFSVQIYCDFSGYSDIAVGTAKLFGIDLMINFKSPYLSQSIKEFWSRWHISLSTWFRDYVYIPLGGNRVKKARHNFNLIVTFLASGLWHGANWTFVVWGGLHGVAQALENIIIPPKYRKSSGFVWGARVLLVFMFSSFAWIFFAANSIGDACYVVSHMSIGMQEPITYLHAGFSALGLRMDDFIFLCVSVLMLTIYDVVSLKKDVIYVISKKRTVVRWTIYCLFVIWVVMNIPVAETAEFIYFQF